MNYKLDKKKFDNVYFEGKPMYDKVNGETFNVVYMREYIDPESESETFWAYETIYRNVPNKYRSKFDNEKMKMKMLKYCDWNYKDMATNFTNVTNIEFKTEKEYYNSFADVFGDVMSKDEYKREKLHMFNDYGQQYDRSSLRKDFNPKLTKSKVYSYNGKKCH
jgi:hypothetical protein